MFVLLLTGVSGVKLDPNRAEAKLSVSEEDLKLKESVDDSMMKMSDDDSKPKVRKNTLYIPDRYRPNTGLTKIQLWLGSRMAPSV